MSEKEKRLLGITTDSNIFFRRIYIIYINNICKMASQKLNSLAQIAGYYEHTKTKSYNEIIYYISVWLLSNIMDIPQQNPKSLLVPYLECTPAVN